MAWYKNLPSGAAPVRDGDDAIRANNLALETAIGQDHEFSAGGTNSGKHKKLTLEEQSGDQTTGANEMGLYCKDLGAAPGLYIRPQSDGAVVQLTDAAGKIVGAGIADDTIDSQHYAAASIDNEHLANNAVDSDELAAGAVDLAHLAAAIVETSGEGLTDVDTALPTSAAVQDEIESQIAALDKEDTLLTQATAGIFGPWTRNDTTPAALAEGTTYLAECDGEFSGYADGSGQLGRTVEIFIDTTKSNVNGEGAAYCRNKGSGYNIGACAFVAKGEYVRMKESGGGSCTINWKPIGTGGLVAQ